MKRFLSVLALSFFSLSSSAYPLHQFWCVVGEQKDMKQVYFEIEDADVASGIGNITLSRWVIPPNAGEYEETADCGMADGPCKVLISPKWVAFEQAQVKAKISWAEKKGVSHIAGFQADMGRTGYVNVLATGKVSAEVMGFNYPNGIDAKFCNHFYAVGPRPGLTGSN